MANLQVPTHDDLTAIFPGHIPMAPNDTVVSRHAVGGIVDSEIVESNRATFGTNSIPDRAKTHVSRLLTGTLTNEQAYHGNEAIKWLCVIRFSKLSRGSQVNGNGSESVESYRERIWNYCEQYRYHLRQIGIKDPEECLTVFDLSSTTTTLHCNEIE